MTERLAFIDVMGRLNRAAREAGGISALARKLGMPRQDVHAALNASRAPSASLLAAVGVRKVVTTTYETIDPPAPRAPGPVPEAGICSCPATGERACMNPACPRQPEHLRQTPNEEAA